MSAWVRTRQLCGVGLQCIMSFLHCPQETYPWWAQYVEHQWLAFCWPKVCICSWPTFQGSHESSECNQKWVTPLSLLHTEKQLPFSIGRADYQRGQRFFKFLHSLNDCSGGWGGVQIVSPSPSQCCIYFNFFFLPLPNGCSFWKP